jgi:hypothetical protein
MTETVSQLAQFLSEEHTAAEVSGRVGKIIKDRSAPQPMVLEPHLPGVQAATLGLYKTGKPYVLRLQFQADARPTLAAMREKFGAFERLDTDLGQRPHLSCTLPPGPAWQVVLIAELGESDRIVSLAFRRDPVTKQ